MRRTCGLDEAGTPRDNSKNPLYTNDRWVPFRSAPDWPFEKKRGPSTLKSVPYHAAARVHFRPGSGGIVSNVVKSGRTSESEW